MSDVNKNLYGDFDDLPEEIIRFVPGTVNKVKMASVSYFEGPSKTGNHYECIKILYEGKLPNGKALITDMIMPLNTENMKTWNLSEDQSYEDLVRVQKQNFNAKMKHIASKLDIEHDELKAEVSEKGSFKEFANAYVNLLNKKLAEHPTRMFNLKISCDKNGNPSLPLYVPFLEIFTENVHTGLTFSDKEKAYINRTLADKAAVTEDTIIEESDELDSI